MACNETRNPLHRDGTSQAGRFLKALDPDYIKVDERSLEDLMEYAVRYAKEVRFYDSENEVDGDWQELFEGDITTLVSIMLKTDPKEDDEAFEQAKEDLLETLLSYAIVAPTPEEAKALVRSFRDLMGIMYNMFLRVDSWLRGISPDVQLGIRTEIVRAIRPALQSALQDFIAIDKKAYAELAVRGYRQFSYSFLDDEWFILYSGGEYSSWEVGDIVADPNAFTGSNMGEKLLQILTGSTTGTSVRDSYLQDTFESLYEQTLRLVNNAPGYLEKTIEEYPYHQAHVALFITFLKLMEYERDLINELTAKHLDFYYKDVLQLEKRDFTPDSVHVLFELAKNVSEYKVAEGTLLKAGKDDDGNDVYFEVDPELVVNQASIDQIKTFFINKWELNGDPELPIVRNLYAAPIANSADGLGTEIEDDPASWPTFGEDQSLYLDEQRTLPDAEVGFAIASPVLVLNEGLRTISFKFNFETTNFESDFVTPFLADADPGATEQTLEYIMGNALSVYLSGAEEWIEPSELAVFIGREDNNGTYSPSNTYFIVRCQYLADKEAITYYNGETLKDEVVYDTEWPLARILLNSDTHGYVFEYLRSLRLTSINVGVDVNNISNLVVQNDLGQVDPSKPFFPFGTSPVDGSSLYVGNAEIFSKELSSLEIDISWLNPPTNLETHYSDYKDSNGNPYLTSGSNNTSFLTQVQYLKDFSWRTAFDPVNNVSADAMPLFHPTDATQGVNIEVTTPDLGRNENLKTLTPYRPDTRRGFVRLVLTPQDFLHGLYNKVFTNAVLANVAVPNSTPLPNEPYTPQIKTLSLSYQSEVTLDFSGTLAENFTNNEVEQIFHIHPFGYAPIQPVKEDSFSDTYKLPKGTINTQYFMPQYRLAGQGAKNVMEGALYLGINKLDVPRSLSVLFQFAEGTENIDLDSPDITFSYLSNNEWIDLEGHEIPTNTTNNDDVFNKIVSTGRIVFTIPREATSTNTLFPAGLHWLRVAVPENSQSIPQLIEVLPQAALATFTDKDNNLNRLASAMEADSISGLKTSANAIKGVSQPYSSFDGKVPEEDDNFYQRVSERLRHKNRAINIWDYEHLVLEEFPNLYKVKCLNHTSQSSEIAPGNVGLVLIPNLKNVNSVNILQPRVSVSTLDKVESFIKKKMPAWVTLMVTNPIYEKVQVDFEVSFREGYDPGYYENQLEEEIIQYLSPWAFDEGADIAFGGSVYKSVILNFIEEREYVDYVKNLEMFHIVNGRRSADTNEIVATTSRSILVSASSHSINE